RTARAVFPATRWRGPAWRESWFCGGVSLQGLNLVEIVLGVDLKESLAIIAAARAIGPAFDGEFLVPSGAERGAAVPCARSTVGAVEIIVARIERGLDQ